MTMPYNNLQSKLRKKVNVLLLLSAKKAIPESEYIHV